MNIFRFIKRQQPTGEKDASTSAQHTQDYFEKLKGFIIDPKNTTALDLYIQLRLPKSWSIDTSAGISLEEQLPKIGSAVLKESKGFKFEPLPDDAQGIDAIRTSFKSGALVVLEALEASGIDPKSRPIIGPCLLELDPETEKKFGSDTLAAAHVTYRTIRIRPDALDSFKKHLAEELDEASTQGLIASTLAHECGHACAHVRFRFSNSISGRMDARLITEGWCNVDKENYGSLFEEAAATWYQYKCAEQCGLTLGIGSNLSNPEAMSLLNEEFANELWAIYNEIFNDLPEIEKKLCKSARLDAHEERDIRVPKISFTSFGTSKTGEQVNLKVGYGDIYQALRYMVDASNPVTDSGISISVKNDRWSRFENALIAGHLKGEREAINTWLKDNFGERIFDVMMHYPVNAPDGGWMSLFGLTFALQDKGTGEVLRERLITLFDRFLRSKPTSQSGGDWGYMMAITPSTNNI